LLSAIPWIGKDFVEFVFLIFIKYFIYFVIIFSLTTIGIINIRALRGQKIRTASDKNYAEDIPYAFLAMFVGLVDADFNNYWDLGLIYNNNNLDLGLIVWGSSMSSNIGYPRFNKLTSTMIELPLFQFSLLIGLLLSDGWLTYASPASKNARLGFKQSLTHFMYFWFVFNSLTAYCSSLPHLAIGKRNNTLTYAIEIFSRSLPCFTNLHSLFYVNGLKIVPVDIFHYLNSIALAHWIMGDGKYVKSGGLILCTDSFTLKEVLLLMNVLIIKYDFKCSLHQPAPNSYRIYISKTSMAKLQDLVLPYMVKNMLYKIHK
jgi:hypothetical protein